MILEGIVTTLSADGTVNISPMGPSVDAPLTRLVLQALSNVDHVSESEAHGPGRVPRHRRRRAAGPGGRRHARPAAADARRPRPCEGRILSGRLPLVCLSRPLARRSRSERTRNRLRRGRPRDASRVLRLQPGQACRDRSGHPGHADRVSCPPARSCHNLSGCKSLVEKTGGPAERRAFEFLKDYVSTRCPSARD